jgi:putative ABC transport system permease protein
MRALDLKLFRDLRRLWPQALAIALVVGGGVATMVMAVGSIRSMEETRAAYYERYQFADVFASVKRAPKTLMDQIEKIPGVAAAERASSSSPCSTFRTFASRPPASSFRFLTRPSPGSIGFTCVRVGRPNPAEPTKSSSTSPSPRRTNWTLGRASRRS